jgi:hypothetical protein
MRAFKRFWKRSSLGARGRAATFRIAAAAIKLSLVAGLRFVVAAALLAILPAPPAIAQLDPCVPGQSCFTNVGDILNGQRHLLRTDDLLIGGQFGSVFAGAILDTTNSAVTASAASSLSGNSNACPNFSPTFRTAVSARMFNLNHDVTMSVACWGGFSLHSCALFRPGSGSAEAAVRADRLRQSKRQFSALVDRGRFHWRRLR